MKRLKRQLKTKNNKLPKQINKLIAKTNTKIKSLKNKGFDKYSPAYKNLINKLSNNKMDFVDKKGNIKKVKNFNNLTMIKKRALKNSLENFMNLKTSTKRGVNERFENVKKGINEKLFDGKLNNNQLNTIANFFDNQKFGKLANKVGGSDLLIITNDSIEKDYTKEEFMNELLMYKDIDSDTEKELMKLYEDIISA